MFIPPIFVLYFWGGGMFLGWVNLDGADILVERF